MMRSCYLPALNSSFVVCELTGCKLCVCSLKGKQTELLIDRNLIMLTVKQAGSHLRWMGNNSLPSPISAGIYVSPWTRQDTNFHDADMFKYIGQSHAGIDLMDFPSANSQIVNSCLLSHFKSILVWKQSDTTLREFLWLTVNFPSSTGGQQGKKKNVEGKKKQTLAYLKCSFY